MFLETKATILGLAAGIGVLGATFATAALLRPTPPAATNGELPANIVASLTGEAKRGYDLYDHNCPQCHGDDARGDEGPALFDLTKSDARLSKIIKQGVKGEMPKFGSKFSDADVQSLVSFLHALKS